MHKILHDDDTDAFQEFVNKKIMELFLEKQKELDAQYEFDLLYGEGNTKGQILTGIYPEELV